MHKSSRLSQNKYRTERVHKNSTKEVRDTEDRCGSSYTKWPGHTTPLSLPTSQSHQSSNSSTSPLAPPPHPPSLSHPPIPQPEERAKLLKVVLDQRQAEKDAKVREEAEARQGGTAFRARTPVPAPVAPPVAPPVRERVAPVVTPVPAPVKAVVAEAPKVS